MPLNILHHKSYHVYNRKNIEKVKRDENQAKIYENEKRSLREKLQREQRLRLLRNSNEEGQDELKHENDVMIEPIKHVNFFEDVENPRSKAAKNIVHEEKSPFAKQPAPWYEKSKVNKEDSTKKFRYKKVDPELAKSLHDPLNEMNKFIQQTKQYRIKQEALERQFGVTNNIETSSSSTHNTMQPTNDKSGSIKRDKSHKKSIHKIHKDEHHYRHNHRHDRRHHTHHHRHYKKQLKE